MPLFKISNVFIAILALFITLVGIPIGFISLFGYILLMYLSKLFAAVYLGQMFVDRFMSKKGLFLTFAIGLTLFYLLGIIPILGKLAQFILSLSAIGALLTEKKAVYQSLSKTKVV